MPSAKDFTTALLRYIGTPYEWGGKDTGGLDCSGLITLALADIGVPFVHGSSNQIEACTPISVDRAWDTAGALLYRPGHDAISLGNGTAVEAIRPHVQVTPRTETYAGAPRFTRAGLVPGITYATEAPVGIRHTSPATGRLTSRFGPRSIKPSPHHGIDIAPPRPGQAKHPYYATADGVVERVVNLGSTYRHPEAPGNSGWLIKIRHADGSQTWYQHSWASEIFVSQGQRVRQGQLLGYMGASGGSNTMGVHLHFEYHPTGTISYRTDPLALFGGSAARAVAGPPADLPRTDTPTTADSPEEDDDMPVLIKDPGRNQQWITNWIIKRPIDDPKVSEEMQRKGVELVEVAQYTIDRIPTLDSLAAPARVAAAQTAGIHRGGKTVSLRQEVADSKTMLLELEGVTAGLLTALADVSTGRDVDLDAVKDAARDGVADALASVEADVTLTIEKEN